MLCCWREPEYLIDVVSSPLPLPSSLLFLRLRQLLSQERVATRYKTPCGSFGAPRQRAAGPQLSLSIDTEHVHFLSFRLLSSSCRYNNPGITGPK